MKVVIVKDSAYPVYAVFNLDDDVSGEDGETIEIDNELYERYKSITKQYGEMQDELENFYKEG